MDVFSAVSALFEERSSSEFDVDDLDGLEGKAGLVEMICNGSGSCGQEHGGAHGVDLGLKSQRWPVV